MCVKDSSVCHNEKTNLEPLLMRKVTGPRKRPRQSFGNPPLKIKKKKSSDKSAYILKIGEHLIFFKLVLNIYEVSN